MNINPLLEIDKIVKIVTSTVVEDMSNNIESCERVFSWLCDEESQKAYLRELVFIHLRLILVDNLGVAAKYTMPQDEWDKALKSMYLLREKKLLPKFDTALPEDHHEFMSALTLTFVLNQYSYKDLMTIQKGDIVFDCGGYFGESSAWFMQKGAAKSYIFEPSPSCIPRIKSNIKNFGEQERMILVPCALGSEPSVVPFKIYEQSPGSSCVEQEAYEGTVSVQQITLDDWCAENNVVPDFIKMDIEGAEVEAIKGASNIIAKYKPRLAICLYHRISDMWVIPTMLKELCPEYSFWCKKNAMPCEFVLYAKVL